MTGWIKRLFQNSHDDPESKRLSQNAWIGQKFLEWQKAWHDAFDEDSTLREAGEYQRPDPLPGDIDTDYRLIFGLSNAELKTRETCFSLFPAGAEMHRRFDSYLCGRRDFLSKAEALELVAKIALCIEEAKPRKSMDWTKVRILDRHAPATQDLLANTDHMSFLFEQNLLEPTPDTELAGVAARLFLSEALYVSAGNWFELGDWVTAAMFDPARDKVYALCYQLSCAGWSLHLAENGVVLAHDSTEANM